MDGTSAAAETQDLQEEIERLREDFERFEDAEGANLAIAIKPPQENKRALETELAGLAGQGNESTQTAD